MPSLTTSSPSSETASLWLCSTEPDLIAAETLTEVVKAAFPGRAIQIQPMSKIAPNNDELILAVTLHPILSLAMRLGKGADSEAALAEWKQWANTLLKMQRRNRRRIVLVEPQVLVDDSFALERNFLAARLSESHFTSSASSSEKCDLIPDPEPLDMLCATALLDSGTEVRSLAEELQAATIGAKSQVVDVAVVEQARRNLFAAQADKETLADLFNERELLYDNLRYNVEKLEGLTSKRSDLETQLADGRRKSSDLETRLADERRKSFDLKSQLAGELLRISDLKAKAQSDVLNMRRERDAAVREATKHKNNINKILATKSWRMMAPLRAIRGLF